MMEHLTHAEHAEKAMQHISILNLRFENANEMPQLRVRNCRFEAYLVPKDTAIERR